MNKIDRSIMKCIYYQCTKEKSLVINPKREAMIYDVDILSSIPYNIRLKRGELYERIVMLATSDYFEVKVGKKNGSVVYLFSLLNKGKSFIQEINNEKRAIRRKILLTVFGAVGSFIIGLLLRAI